MGLCGSSPNKVASNAGGEVYTALDKKVASILGERAKKKKADSASGNPSKDDFSWDRIILKFPGIEANFRRVGDVFNKYDTDGDAAINMDELRKCMEDLGSSLTEEELKGLFQGVDIDESKHLDKKEFLLCLAIGYVTGYFSGQDTVAGMEHNITLTETFDLVIHAFLTFDESGDGFIDRDEVMTLFAKDGPNKASNSQRASMNVISQQRWKEMDWNSDGSISFKEFLLAFGSWVGLDDEES